MQKYAKKEKIAVAMAMVAKINELHAFLFITRQKLNRQSFRKIYFFLLPDHNGGCLMATENDS